MLDLEEEERLHVLGTARMEEADWVEDVMRLRETKVRVMRKHEVCDTLMVSKGTRSRPKRRAVPP
jgi:hypothetical protein